MRIRVEVEVPNWSRWLVAGLCLGLGLGFGAGQLWAQQTFALKVDWKPGNTLRADDLNRNFETIRAALSSHEAALAALRSPECPVNYTRDTADPSLDGSDVVLCRRGFDEMVRVGYGESAFWIDRYEASIWSSPDGSGMQYDTEYPTTFPISGQYASQLPLYAVSKAGVMPAAFLTWFQADAACEASGKTLPSRTQWLRAARGTNDLGATDGSGGTCLLQGVWQRNTGLGANCSSRWGAQDMIGNLWESTDEWYASITDATDWGPIQRWTQKEFSQDGVWGVVSNAFEHTTGDISVRGLPVVASRGGSYATRTDGGLFALGVQNAPSNWSQETGFRCVISR